MSMYGPAPTSSHSWCESSRFQAWTMWMPNQARYAFACDDAAVESQTAEEG
jgi:hypothetical protein